MKTLITIVILSLVNQSVVAQKKFEGRIVYKCDGSTNNKNGSVEAFFGNKKIKAHITDSSKTETNDDLLIDFEKGIIYYIDLQNREYKKDSIADKHVSLIPPVSLNPNRNKTILGFSCIAYSSTDSSKSKYSGSLFITTWLADSIYFPFNKKYATSDMIQMFGNG